MLQNKQRIKMAIRLMTTLVSNNVLKRDSEDRGNLFKVYDDINVLDGLVNVIVSGKIENKIKMEMANGKEGKVWMRPNSILNTIDLNLLDNGINYKYPIFKEAYTRNFADRVFTEVSFYKNVVVSDMRNLRNEVNQMISETNNVDYTELFHLNFLEDKAIYKTFIEKDYFFKRNIPELKISYEDSIGLPINDVESVLRNVKNSELSIMVDNALNEMPNKEDLIAKLSKLLSSSVESLVTLSIKDTDTIFWYIVLLENYLKSENSLNTLTNRLTVFVLNTLIDKFNFYLNKVSASEKNDVVILNAEKNSDNEILISVIKKNLIKLSNEDDFNLNIIYGIYSLFYFSNEDVKDYTIYKIDKILNKKQEFYENFDRGMKLYNTESKNSNIEKIRGMYMITFNTVFKKYLPYSTFDNTVQMSDSVYKFIRNANLGELLDTYNAVENIIKGFLTNNTNYPFFEEAMDTATKVMGEDIEVTEASVYATIELISEYFVNQLTVR